jgi:hypothetical protein
MSLLKLSLAVTLATQAAACVIVDDDGSYAASAITMRWTFQDLETQQATACPAGFDTVAVGTQAVDALGPYGATIVDLYDCGDAAGTGLFDPGVYDTWMEVMTPDLSSAYADSLITTVDVFDRDAFVDNEILNDGGYFLLSWDLIGETSNRVLGCADAGVDQIEAVSASATNAEQTTTDAFACGDHFGITGGFVTGDYTVTLRLSNDGRPIDGAVDLSTRTVNDRNKVTDLGHVMIPIAGR